MSGSRAVPRSKGSAKKRRRIREPAKRAPQPLVGRPQQNKTPRWTRQIQLAHDLGNSIGAASLHVQVLGGSASTPEQREGLEAAKRQLRVATGQLAELRRLIRES